MLSKSEAPAEKKDVVVIKKYANRRLYNTETSAYVTLDDLASMVRSDRDFVVYDAKTGDDLTHSVLTQIIVEQESKQGGQTLLPTPFLRQLIRFYDDALAKMVPSYLQFSLDTLTKEQAKFRDRFAHLFGTNPFGAAAFDALQEQTRKNMAIFEQAMAMWTPFATPGAPGTRKPDSPAESAAPSSNAAAAPAEAKSNDLAELKAELARMQEKIEKLSEQR